jgi:hypothetical protein
VSSLSPAIVYKGKAGLQESWVREMVAGKHSVFCSNSPTGWTNNNLGLAWLEQVFDRETKKKARQKWRLLILDGHGSNITNDFIDFCDDNKILLCIFPPHSAHTLQALDVVMFSPMASSYSQELSWFLHRSQGLIGVKKGDFFPIFWVVWMRTFKRETTLKSFEATGIFPMDAQVILKRFRTPTSEQATTPEFSEVGNGNSWRQLRKLFDAAVRDGGKVLQSRLGKAIHSIQVNNELLHYQNDQLRSALTTKKNLQTKSHTLDLQQHKEFHSAAVFWSPGHIREARARNTVKQHKKEEEKLKKSNMHKLKEANELYKKKIVDEVNVRQRSERRRRKQRAKSLQRRARKSNVTAMLQTHKNLALQVQGYDSNTP